MGSEFVFLVRLDDLFIIVIIIALVNIFHDDSFIWGLVYHSVHEFLRLFIITDFQGVNVAILVGFQITAELNEKLDQWLECKIKSSKINLLANGLAAFNTNPPSFHRSLIKAVSRASSYSIRMFFQTVTQDIPVFIHRWKNNNSSVSSLCNNKGWTQEEFIWSHHFRNSYPACTYFWTSGEPCLWKHVP